MNERNATTWDDKRAVVSTKILCNHVTVKLSQDEHKETPKIATLGTCEWKAPMQEIGCWIRMGLTTLNPRAS